MMKPNRKTLVTAISFLFIGIIATSVVWVYASPTSTFTISGGVYPSAPSFTIWREGVNYFAKNALGQVQFETTNSCDLIIDSLDALGQTGGRLFFRVGIFILTTPLHYILDEAPDTPYPIEIVGEGKGTIFQYEGTGWAMNISTDYTTNGYVVLSNFRLEGVTKTTGRHGLLIDKVGRNVFLEKLSIYHFDVGLGINDTNTFYVEDFHISGCNTGIQTEGGSSSSANAIRFNDFKISYCTNYGIYLDGGNSISIERGVFEDNGNAVYSWGGWNHYVGTSYFENNGVGVNFTGLDNTYPTSGGEIENCYFTNNSDYAIYLGRAVNIKIDSIKSRWHDVATIYLHDSQHGLVVINPSISHFIGSDPYLFDGSPTQVNSRLAGQVITERWQGVIAMSANTMDEGTVCYWSAGGTVANATTTNQTNVGVVGFAPAGANKPSVVVTSGITEVYVKAGENIAVGDVLIASTTSGQAIESDDATDWISVIGYSVEADADGGELNFALIK